MKQEYLMLGHIFKPEKVNPAGWYVSEKLDGVRAYWDGGISRGMSANDVPYSNTIKDVNPQTATGLWSRTGKVIHAPDWWLDYLPNFPLDGELFIGRGKFQETYSIVSRYYSLITDWKRISYKIFDSPPYETFLKPRIIKVRDYQFSVRPNTWVGNGPKLSWTFEWVLLWLKNKKIKNPVLQLVKQFQLPFSYVNALETIDKLLSAILERKGEGLILRKPVSFWITERSHFLLKYKPFLDAEGTVVGYKMGEGKYEGMMGSLILKSEDEKIFKISGFTDIERLFGFLFTGCQPGQECFFGKHCLFPIGSRVTYKYRELSDAGVPKEPRYYRKGN